AAEQIAGNLVAQDSHFLFRGDVLGGEEPPLPRLDLVVEKVGVLLVCAQDSGFLVSAEILDRDGGTDLGGRGRDTGGVALVGEPVGIFDRERLNHAQVATAAPGDGRHNGDCLAAHGFDAFDDIPLGAFKDGHGGNDRRYADNHADD